MSTCYVLSSGFTSSSSSGPCPTPPYGREGGTQWVLQRTSVVRFIWMGELQLSLM